MTRRDGLSHYLGCFLGGAAGDALGGAVEFMSLTEIRRRFGPDGIRDPAPAYGRTGAITDDTQMLLFTAEGLIRARHRLERGAAPVEQAVWWAYWRWLRTQGERPASMPPDHAALCPDGWLFGVRELHARRAPGSTCLAALRSGLMGTPQEPLNDSKGCGGAMRVAPVGLAPSDAFDLGERVAALTHGHPTGYVAAGFFAEMIHGIVEGRGLLEAAQAALERTRAAPGNAETVASVERALGLASRSEGAPRDVESLGGGWVAEEAVAIATYCALRARDFAHGVRLAVNHSGDSDSTGSLTGNLLGLLHGEQAIPRRWLETLELRGVIAALAEDFWWHFAARPPAPCGGGGDCGLRQKYPGA